MTPEIVVSVDAENTIEGDLRLERGDLVWLTDVESRVAQRLRSRMRFFRGEWFLDLREGVPYYQRLLVKNPSRATILGIFSRVIRETPGIAALERIDYTIDARTRELSLTFVARLDSGKIFSSADYGPFVVGDTREAA